MNERDLVMPMITSVAFGELHRALMFVDPSTTNDEETIPMFERFTDRARRAVTLAGDNARTLGHSNIGTEHLLLGLLQEGGGVACQALTNLGVNSEGVRVAVVRIIGSGDVAPEGHIPFTPRAKKVLELALREALQLGHTYIGTEHLLLAVEREGEGVAARILTDCGLDLHGVRQEVIKVLSGYTGPSGQQQTAQQPEPDPWLAKATAAFDQGRFREAAAAAVIGLLSATVQDTT